MDSSVGGYPESLTLGALPAWAAQDETVKVNTLTGAYLAARIAEML